MAVAVGWGASVAAGWSTGVGPRAQELADGPGRIIVLNSCDSTCHGIDEFMDQRRSKTRWVQTIQTMKRRGLEISDADLKVVIGYLTARNGILVRINEASAKEIDDSMDLAPGQAQAIVRYRDANGPFAGWKDLLKVPKLDARKLGEQRANIVF